ALCWRRWMRSSLATCWKRPGACGPGSSRGNGLRELPRDIGAAFEVWQQLSCRSCLQAEDEAGGAGRLILLDELRIGRAQREDRDRDRLAPCFRREASKLDHTRFEIGTTSDDRAPFVPVLENPPQRARAIAADHEIGRASCRE